VFRPEETAPLARRRADVGRRDLDPIYTGKHASSLPGSTP
jgi:hypothetical protein